ncbi:hypothetical protein ACHQM5_010899 [Ranunculus cassubicifolius]
MVDKIRERISLQQEVNVSELILTVTNNVISRVALSRRLGNSEYGESVKDAMNLFGHSTVEDMFPLLKWIDVLTGVHKRMKTTSTTILQFFDKVIEEHLIARKNNGEQSGRRDFVDLLLDYEEDSQLTGAEFTRENLKGVLMVRNHLLLSSY